ncbi:MAG: hypothetical protein Crog4KO_26790 [Crocinitomicaceae bacterium]
MESEIAEWNSELKAFDAQKWKGRLQEVSANIEQLKQLEADTISLEDALVIDAYRNVQMEMIQVQSLHDQCEQGLKLIEHQIKKLKTDINAGNGRRDKYDQFIAEEEAQLEILREIYTLYKSTVEKIEKEFPEYQNSVNSIIAERLLEEGVQ